ncbi:MAG: hypothetical protein U1F83_13225 [Verrucomicrobiota bacterium]
MMIHLGIVLLLVGQFATDLLSTESSMHLRVGETKNYSEADRAYELAVVDTTDAQADRVLTIAGHRLQPGREVPLPGLPFTVKVKQYFINSALSDKPQTNLVPVEVNAGIGMGLWWTPLAHETEMNKRDIPSGTMELATPQGSLGLADLRLPGAAAGNQARWPHLPDFVAPGALLQTVQHSPAGIPA